jgi:hypothetical protein
VLHARFPEIKSVFIRRAILVACPCIFAQIPEQQRIIRKHR